jgi:o-succinylbenzoate---CoA ligase
MAWISYKAKKFDHEEWRELVEILRGEGSWQQEVARTINQWQSKMNPLIAHTSGSTGAPKEIQLQRTHVEASAQLTNETFGLSPGITALFCLPAQFIAGKMMVIRALVNEWNLVLASPNADALKNVGGEIDFAAMTPYQVEQSLVRFPTTFSKIKQLIIGGASIPDILENELNEQMPQCFATYGMTETITHIAIRAVNGKNASAYFRALGGINLSQDLENCLVIQAKHLGEDVIVTNDIVEFNSAGAFQVLGRRDNVINSGGVKLLPEDIEKKISRFVFRRYYIGKTADEQFGERPVLVLEGELLDKQIESGMLEAFGTVLSSIEMPVKIDYVGRFEETETGKIIRRQG